MCLCVSAIVTILFLSVGPQVQVKVQAQNQTQTQTQSQNQTQTEVTPYVDTLNDIFLFYPSDWTTFDTSYPDLASFLSPKENLSDLEPPAELVISLQRYQQNVSLDEHTNQIVTELAAPMPIPQNQTQPPASLRTSDPVTVAGYPGHRVTYKLFDDLSQTNVDVMELWTVVDGNKLYTIAYVADSFKFNKYLPDAMAMIDSLGIGNSTSTGQ